jgi:hypothetical protein
VGEFETLYNEKNFKFFNNMEEIHPIINGFIQPDSKLIIIETFSPRKEWVEKGKAFFFYSLEKNHFWNRIDNIFNFSNGLKKTKSKNSNESLFDNKIRKENFSKK